MSYPYEPYKWWVNNILPVVYDDSLSYYEVLSKLRYYIDGLIGDVKRLTEIVNTIEGIDDIEQFTEMLNQIKDEIGDLENLQTANKDDIVNAINGVVYDLGIVKLAVDKKYTKPETGIPESDLSDELKEKINEQFEQDKNYNNLNNKPKINHIEIEGDHDPRYYGIGTYNLPENGIPESDLADGVKDKLNASSENTEKIDGIAPSIDSMTADRNYEVGEILYINGKLYRVTAKVIANTPFVIGSNIEQTTLNNEIDSINEEISKLKIATGAESYDRNSGEIITQDTNVYTLFFNNPYFKGIAGEEYLFIVRPNVNTVNGGYNINIYNENGEVAFTFNSGNNIADYKNERRFTFTPLATDNYYCGIKKDRDGSSFAVEQTIILRYTPSQGSESLVQMVSELIPLKEDVEGFENAVEALGSDVANLYDAKNAFDEYPDAIMGAFGKRPAIFYPGYYSTPNVGITVSERRPHEYFVCTRFKVKPGDRVTFDVTGSVGYYRAYVWIDEAGKAINKTSVNLTGKRTVIAPENAVEIAINNRVESQDSGYYAYIGSDDENRFLSPNGSDQTDEIVSELNSKGICQLGKGDFLVNNIVMPNGTKLIGCGESTKLYFSNSDANRMITMGDKCTIKDISLYGNTEEIVLNDDLPGVPIETGENIWTQGNVSVSSDYTDIVLANPLPPGTYRIAVDLVRNDDNNNEGSILLSSSNVIDSNSIFVTLHPTKNTRYNRTFTTDRTTYAIRFVSAYRPSNTLPSEWLNFYLHPINNTKVGIVWSGDNKHFGIIEGCRFYRFSEAGLLMQDTGTPVDNNMCITNNFFTNCNIGAYIRKSSEYNRFCNNVFARCYYGCLNRGGNNYFVNCGFDGNYIGMQVDENEGSNAGHGSINNCSFNHSAPSNTGYGFILDHEQREKINSCRFGYSKIKIISGAGITFNDCMLSVPGSTIEGGRFVLFSSCTFTNQEAVPTLINNTESKLVNCFSDIGGANITNFNT